MEEKLAWLTGIIEGEGSVGIYWASRKDNPSKLSPIYNVSIINTDMAILARCKEIFDEIGVYANINNKSQKSPKQCYELIVRRRLDVGKLLLLVEPYLIGEKKGKAKLMLAFFKKNKWKKQVMDYSMFSGVETECMPPSFARVKRQSEPVGNDRSLAEMTKPLSN